MEIEQASYSQPWTLEQFVQELQLSYSRVLLLFYDLKLVGYLCFWMVADELHILNIATAPACRRRGVARRLLAQAFDLAREQQIKSAYLEVRRGNVGAIDLYRSFGFVENSIRPKYYSDAEDALLMSCSLMSPPSDGV